VVLGRLRWRGGQPAFVLVPTVNEHDPRLPAGVRADIHPPEADINGWIRPGTGKLGHDFSCCVLDLHPQAVPWTGRVTRKWDHQPRSGDRKRRAFFTSGEVGTIDMSAEKDIAE